MQRFDASRYDGSHQTLLDLMAEIAVDYLVVGDAGVFYVTKRDGYNFKLIYDTSVFVTSSRQVNFWGQHGAVESVLARKSHQQNYSP